MKSRALVLYVIAENLDALNEWWLGVIIAPTTKVVVGDGCCRMAHWTVRCASHITQLLGFDHWSSDMWGHQTVRCCTGQSLFTVWCAFWRCSDFARTVRALFSCQSTVGVDRCAWESLLRWHTRQSDDPPDSPVNCSGARPQKPEGEEFEVDPPWCTGHCPVRQTRVHFGFFCSFLLNPNFNLFIGLC